jgi:tRNA(His) guanylyltransferase
MKDELGDRIKDQYEDRTRFFVPRRTYTIIRVDGKAFHTLTKNFKRPFDPILMRIMDNTARALCKEIQGARFAYTQSDEISILLTDFSSIQTNAWFDGNVQKMCSVAAACATAHFNREMMQNGVNRQGTFPVAMFDGRVFTIPDPIEVENYFIWRQNDASRNSIQMAARAVYSHKELDGKNVGQLHELLHAKGINWNNYTSGEKRGRCIVKERRDMSTYPAGYTGFQNGQAKPPETIIRHEWVSLAGDLVNPVGEAGKADPCPNETPVFTRDREFLRKMIPTIDRTISEDT